MKKKMKESKSGKSKSGMYLCEEGMIKSEMPCKYEVPYDGGYKVLENALSEVTSPQKIYGTGEVNTSRQIVDDVHTENTNITAKPKSFSKED